MTPSIHEFSPVLTDDGMVWIVHGILDGSFVCRPKYVPDAHGRIRIGETTYERLHSPVFSETGLVLPAWHKYNAMGLYRSLFVIKEKDIKKAYRYDTPIGNRTQTAQVASRLIHDIVLTACVSPAEIGFIGSLILHSETDGYSDIDLAFSNENALTKALSIMEKLPGIHLRNTYEWRMFYRKMNVQGVDEKSFVKTRKGTKLQGFYCNIPFSIFLIREHLLEFTRYSGVGSAVEKTGILHGRNGGIYNYPINGTLVAADGEYNVMIWDRRYVGLGIFDRPITLKGMCNGRDIVLSPSYDNLIFNTGE